ncbi:MAG: hypothetical protein L6R42_007661 [Xanthoria sp. 1 TBL-2021]|nr:MAG: hypothetical protein L6R42_007661 [Xanthoria sp. 1 TBL-2021]
MVELLAKKAAALVGFSAPKESKPLRPDVTAYSVPIEIFNHFARMSAANINPATLPPPSTFDIIPPLHTTLSRLLLSDSTTSPTSPSSSGNQGPLSPKDLAAAVSEVRARITRARSIIAGMQDSDRTIEDQKEEIEELKAVLAKIGKPKVA